MECGYRSTGFGQYTVYEQTTDEQGNVIKNVPKRKKTGLHLQAGCPFSFWSVAGTSKASWRMSVSPSVDQSPESDPSGKQILLQALQRPLQVDGPFFPDVQLQLFLVL